MKKIFCLIFLYFIFTSLQSFAYEDSSVKAQRYNKQAALAYSHAMNAQGTEKRYFLKEAKWFYEQSVKTYPDNFEGFIGLAKSCLYLGLFQKAYENLMVAYNFDKTNVMVNYYLGEYGFLNERYTTALEFYLEAIKYGHQNNYNTNYQVALCYDKLGDARNALIYYKKCLDINPDAKNPKIKIEEIENRNAKHADYYNGKNSEKKNAKKSN